MFIRWIERTKSQGTFRHCYLCETQRVSGKPNPENRTLAALGKIALDPSKAEIEVFWVQAKIALDKQNLSKDQRTKIELALTDKVPRGSKAHEKFISSKSDEHNTPPNILEGVYECLGELDLDPCSNSHSQPNVRAKKHFTTEDDGLTREWHGRIFMNPPFSDIKRWVPHIIEEYSSGRVTEAIALTKADTRTKWYRKLRESCQAVCFVEGYHKYGNAQTSATFGTLLTYFGNNPERFCKVFEPFGICKIMNYPLASADQHEYS
jgi:phage N-6-adenine-methyltransferase